jgi:ligand-binding sensor domain-containing protein
MWTSLGRQIVAPGGVLALVWLSGTTGTAAAQDPGVALTQRTVRSWYQDDGLPSSSIASILQGSDGYLWIGTNVGLARFDGARFVELGRDEVGGGITSLCETAGGAIWAGTVSGHLGEYQQGRARRRPGPAPGYAITRLATEPNGDLWVSTLGAGVFRRRAGRYVPQPLPEGVTEILTMVRGRDGSLWMGGKRSGLLRWHEEKWTRLGTEHGLADETVQALLEDAEGRLWVGTEHGLNRLEQGQLAAFDVREGLPHPSITALASDRHGYLWIGTKAGGLARYSEGKLETMSRDEGLASDDVRALLEDHEGNLWAGTAGGLSRIGESLFTTFGQPEGLTAPPSTPSYRAGTPRSGSAPEPPGSFGSKRVVCRASRPCRTPT